MNDAGPIVQGAEGISDLVHKIEHYLGPLKPAAAIAAMAGVGTVMTYLGSGMVVTGLALTVANPLIGIPFGAAGWVVLGGGITLQGFSVYTAYQTYIAPGAPNQIPIPVR